MLINSSDYFGLRDICYSKGFVNLTQPYGQGT